MNKYLIYILILFGIYTQIYSEEWHVKKSENNLVKFTSSTSVLDFDGTTSKIDGYVYWEGMKPFGMYNEIYFEVDLNSVKTGIGKRDRDMREDVLHTNKWPMASFKGSIVNVDTSNAIQNNYLVTTHGKMFIHGYEKEMDINAEISIINNEMNVTCDYSVFLKDYEIEAPSLLAFIKVSEEIKLHLEFQLEKIMENKN